jgi:methanol--5-hydroxybenzimidazolylcobamide Co-methyltransferase
MEFRTLAIPSPDGLVFGLASKPLRTRSGMVIGGGLVYPELNFTLPPMTIDASTMSEIRRQYEEIISGACQRAVELEVPGLVIEFETLPTMVEIPEYGIELTRILLEGMDRARREHKLKTVLRMTPNDLRDIVRPPLMRHGEQLDKMLRCFDGAAEAGAELLSIESIGGKEVCDEALLMCDLPAVIFALGVLGARDMRFLWERIVEIASRRGVFAAGDTACAFGNTAMVLAERKYIPRVFAAVVRAVSAVRSLVAYECGAVGPGKDCGYENIFLKAITGLPMALEGKTAACAHLSPVGNVAQYCCDLWSNESVQNIRLLGGMAPTCYLEQLTYDCRLMNVASADGPRGALSLRDWLVRSDAFLDPQAFILAPESALAVARVIVEADGHYQAAVAAGRTAVHLLKDAYEAGRIKPDPRETPWLDRMAQALEELPADEGAFIDRMLGEINPNLFRPSEYGL